MDEHFLKIIALLLVIIIFKLIDISRKIEQANKLNESLHEVVEYLVQEVSNYFRRQ